MSLRSVEPLSIGAFCIIFRECNIKYQQNMGLFDAIFTGIEDLWYGESAERTRTKLELQDKIDQQNARRDAMNAKKNEATMKNVLMYTAAGLASVLVITIAVKKITG